MARFTGASWQPLPENETQAKIVPTQFIVHTAVDHPGPSNLPGYFGRDDVTVESHFWIPLDGRTVQMIDTNVRADANLQGNVRAISVETEDEGDPEGNPWTPAQVEALIELMTWVRQTHGIPMERMPAWDKPGVGWHSMWGFDDPIKLVGIRDNPWTNARGKTCPGRTRITQFLEEILPAFDPVDPRDARIAELEANIEAQQALQQKHRTTSQRLRLQSQRLREDLVAMRERALRAEATPPPPVPSISTDQYEQMQRAAAAAQGREQALRAAIETAAGNLAAALEG